MVAIASTIISITMSTKALGRNYFPGTGYRIAAMRVRSHGDRTPSHPYDLTEIEHDHDFMELVIMVRGRAQQRLEGEDYAVSSGDVYILQSRSRHYFYDINDMEIINILFDPARVSLPLAELRKIPGYSALFLLEPQYRRRHKFSSRLHLGPEALAEARRIGEDMIDETRSRQPGANVMLLSKLLELILFLSRQYGKNPTVEVRELLRIDSVIGRMEREYQKSWSVDELCRLAGMSRSTFLRTFERAVGHTPIDYLIRLRVAAAMTLLANTGQSVTEIAFQTGFSDSNYFARQFRRITGKTPSRHRGR